MKKPSVNPWLAALVAWVAATGLIAGVFAIWQYRQGQPFRWDLVRDAALVVGPIAVFRAWRDARPKE